MKKSIYKFVSLCLAMGMILSTLAMPALAVERAVHFHSYTITVENERTYYHDNETHRIHVIATQTCTCGQTLPYEYDIYEDHFPTGFGTFEYSITDSTGTITNYYSYMCKMCNERFIVAE